MIDPEVDRKLNESRTLLKLWNVFQQFFETAVKGAGLTPENERKFLELKSRIAMLHDTFVGTVDEKETAVAQSMLENVIRGITLKHLNRLGSADVKKMQIEWHESYLLLNETIGLLEEEHERFAKITPSEFRMTNFKAKVAKHTGNIVHSVALKIGLFLAAFIIPLVILPLMGVYSYRAMRDVEVLQPIVYPVLEKLIRPHFTEVAWVDMERAKRFGYASPLEEFDDFTTKTPTGQDPRTVEQALQKIGKKAQGNASSAKFAASLLKTEYAFDMFDIDEGKLKLSAIYFRFDTTDEAKDTEEQLRTWIADIKNSPFYGGTVIARDCNILMIVEGSNEGVVDGFLEKCWDIAKE